MLNRKRMRHDYVVKRMARIYKRKDKKKWLRATRSTLEKPAVFVPIDPP